MKVSHSRIRCWRACKKRHDYRYNQRLKKRAPPAPLLRGRIIGECLDAVASKQPVSEVLDKYEKQYRRLFREEHEMYGDLIGDVRKIIEGYQRVWSEDGLRYEHTEAPLELELLPGVQFVGYIDKVAMDRSGRRWLIDHKSHRNIPNDEVRQADIQSIFYYWGWNETHPDEPADGFLWDYLRTKTPTVPEVLKNGQLSQKKSIDTDYHTYRQAIIDNGLDPADYAEFLKDLKDQPNQFFKRVHLPNPNKAVVQQVVEETKTEAVLIRALGDVVTTRTLTRECPTCEFFTLCQGELRGHDVSTIRKKDYYHAEEESPEGAD